MISEGNKMVIYRTILSMLILAISSPVWAADTDGWSWDRLNFWMPPLHFKMGTAWKYIHSPGRGASINSTEIGVPTLDQLKCVQKARLAIGTIVNPSNNYLQLLNAGNFQTATVQFIDNTGGSPLDDPNPYAFSFGAK